MIRSKKINLLKPGETLKVKKLSEPEFILMAKSEITQLFTEAVSQKDPSKFADILELINNVCNSLNIDWYECSKIKSQKKWEEGTYECFIVAENFRTD